MGGIGNYGREFYAGFCDILMHLESGRMHLENKSVASPLYFKKAKINLCFAINQYRFTISTLTVTNPITLIFHRN